MRSTNQHFTGFTLTLALTVLLAAPAAQATPINGNTGTGGASVPMQTIDGVTFPASFPAASLNSLRVSNVSAIPVAEQQRPAPRNTTNITTDLYVPGKIQGVNGDPPLAHCRNLANGQRQCVTPAPAGGW